MAAPSILTMNRTLALREDIAASNELALDSARETTHYWHVEKKVVKTTKRGTKVTWKFVRDYWGTKKEAAGFCRRYGIKGDRRLHHMYEFKKETH